MRGSMEGGPRQAAMLAAGVLLLLLLQSWTIAGDVAEFDPNNATLNADGLYNIAYSGESFFRDCVGREEERLFVLSFDDGPHEFTAPILDVLKDKNAPATFFWIGSNWERFPGNAQQYDRLVWRVLLEGHALANHGITNEPFTVPEVRQAHEFLRLKSNGYTPRFFRPAQGAYTPAKIRQVQEIYHDYRFAMWNFDTTDWQADRNPSDILALLEDALDDPTTVAPAQDFANHRFPRRGSFVMLAHDNKQTLTKTVPNPFVSPSDSSSSSPEVPVLAAMIDMIRSKGYRIVSMDECVGNPPVDFDLPSSYCGTAWAEASQCPSDKPCPGGTDAECPDGMNCYGDIVCPTPSPTMVPTVSPVPTMTAEPTEFQPVWGSTPTAASFDRFGWRPWTVPVASFVTAVAATAMLS